MSRYAMEWAKRQQPADSASKVVLLLLGDRAEGASHSGILNEGRLVAESGLTWPGVSRAIGQLRADGLVATEATTDVLGSRAAGFRLLIPAAWRALFITPPKGDGVDVDRPTAVYRLYGASGTLLYVGISDRPEKRFGEHERGRHWWRAVVTRDVVWYGTRRDAEAEEDRAIIADAPTYNVKEAAGLRLTDQYARKGNHRYVVANRRLAAFEKTVARLRDDIEAGAFGYGYLPPVEELAGQYGVDRVTIQQSLERLRDLGVTARSSENPDRIERGDL